MKMSALISLFMFSGMQAFAIAPNRTFAMQAEKSIREYFASGQLQVESIHVDAITRTPTTGAQVYLVEAQVRAQNPGTMQMANYHCGVFIRLLGKILTTQQTSCEILPGTSFRF